MSNYGSWLRIHADALRGAVEDQIATKADIRDMATKADVQQVDHALRQDIAALKAELIKWMIGLIIPLYALLVAVLLSLP